MKSLLTSIATSVLLLAGSFNVATAATILEIPLYSDLNVGTTYPLSDINVTGPISGTYDLLVRYGVWNGGGAQQVDITLTFDGTPLTTINSTNSYYSTPKSTLFDVTSLVQAGLNTLSVIGINISGVQQYAVGGEGAPTPTPLPAALPLFATGIGALGLLGWRRKRKVTAIAA